MSVVMAIDHRPHTEKAFEYALRYAGLFAEELHILCVITPEQEMDGELMLQAMKPKMEEAESRAVAAGLEVRTVIEYGLPAERIMSYAEEVDAVAIILGTSRKSTFERVILGSVSERVTRHALTTVIVVR